MTDALTLAKYIVTKCVHDGYPVSNLQLQKILYFIQVDSLKRTDKAAFPDSIEAWQFGPVVPKVYYYFCGNGALSILDTYEDIIASIPKDSNTERIIEKKRAMNPWDLVNEAHESGRAWATIFQNGKGNRKIIPVDLIREIG